MDVSSLAFDFPDAETYDRLTVDGTLTLAPVGTVSVTVGTDATAPGEYPLLTATTLVGGLDGWAKTISNGSKLSVALVVRGNVLYLRLIPRGTLLFFR